MGSVVHRVLMKDNTGHELVNDKDWSQKSWPLSLRLKCYTYPSFHVLSRNGRIGYQSCHGHNEKSNVYIQVMFPPLVFIQNGHSSFSLSVCCLGGRGTRISFMDHLFGNAQMFKSDRNHREGHFVNHNRRMWKLSRFVKGVLSFLSSSVDWHMLSFTQAWGLLVSFLAVPTLCDSLNDKRCLNAL